MEKEEGFISTGSGEVNASRWETLTEIQWQLLGASLSQHIEQSRKMDSFGWKKIVFGTGMENQKQANISCEAVVQEIREEFDVSKGELYRSHRGADPTICVGCFLHFSIKEVATKSCENLKRTCLLVCFLQAQ